MKLIASNNEGLWRETVGPWYLLISVHCLASHPNQLTGTSILTSDVADKEREGRGWRKKKHVLECGGLSQNLMIHSEYCDFLWHISWQTIFHYQNSRKCKYKDKDEANFYQLSKRKWFMVYLYIFFHNVTWFIFALWWFCLYSVNNDWEWLRNSTWSGVLGNNDIIFHQTNENEYLFLSN